MPKHNNQKCITDYLSSHPGGADLSTLKTVFAPRKVNIKKVVAPMIAKGTLTLTGTLYTLGPSCAPIAIAPRRSRRSSRPIRPTINYPNPIPPYSPLKVFVTTNKLSHCGDIILLTPVNATIVESLIASDPKYRPRAKRLYLSLCVPPATSAPNATFDFRNRSHLDQVILQIDEDNSTFDVAITSGIGSPITARETFCNYILAPKNNFLSELDGPESVIKGLPDKLRAAHPYYNPKSLASKVCKYLHEYYYGNDKFYINDKVVRSVLAYYLDYYGVPHGNLNKPKNRDLDYKDLYEYLEELRKTAGRKHKSLIKRSELDHILWYCYKMFRNKEC